MTAAGVVAVGQQDDGATRMFRRCTDQLLGRGPNGIPNCSRAGETLIGTGNRRGSINDHAAADITRRRNKLDAIDSPSQPLDVSGEALFKGRIASKRNNRGFVFVWSQHIFQKRARRHFFIRQGAFFGSAGIDQNRDREWKIDVLLKGEDLLRLTVFQHANVFGFQIADETFVLVRRSEEDVSEIGFDFDYFVRVLRQLFAFSRCR